MHVLSNSHGRNLGRHHYIHFTNWSAVRYREVRNPGHPTCKSLANLWVGLPRASVLNSYIGRDNNNHFFAVSCTHQCAVRCIHSLTLFQVFLWRSTCPSESIITTLPPWSPPWSPCWWFSLHLYPVAYSPALGGGSFLLLITLLAKRRQDLCCVHFWELNTRYFTVYRVPSGPFSLDL